MTTDVNLELMLTRLINAPREMLFRAWTEPPLLKQWFAPQSHTTPSAELDVRPGGSGLVVMRSPEGQDPPRSKPSPKPMMTVNLNFVDHDGKSRYTARARLGQLQTAKSTKGRDYAKGVDAVPINLRISSQGSELAVTGCLKQSQRNLPPQ
jgi:hypothetical protein